MAPSLRMRSRALERAHILPHGFFSLTTVIMQTAPVDVVRNGVTYSMSLTVFTDPAFGSSSIDVDLSRVQSDGRAFQATTTRSRRSPASTSATTSGHSGR
jgi:hypothetical protein